MQWLERFPTQTGIATCAGSLCVQSVSRYAQPWQPGRLHTSKLARDRLTNGTSVLNWMVHSLTLSLTLPPVDDYTVMMGVEMFLAALMISLIRGTPSVTFMLATPAK